MRIRYLIAKSIELESFPCENKYTRGFYNINSYIIELIDTNSSKLTYLVQYNPGGNVPKAIKKKIQASWVGLR